jgi:CubicO group peptidase (beta-lactamase class C family)
MKKLIILTLILIAAISCQRDLEEVPAYVYTAPEQLNDGIDVGYISEANLDFQKISDLMNVILKGGYPRVHSVLILRYGKLVVEEYHGGWDREDKHNLMSCTKSITSALTGIAKDKNFIQDVNQKVFDFFPGYNYLKDEDKDKIKLVHLLTMTAGLQWDQSNIPSTNPDNSLTQLINSPDWLEYVLGRPVVAAPGEEWVYNGGCSVLLAGIIKSTTGMHADQFAQSFLFGPLGITDYEWLTHDTGLANADYGLKMLPRDMAKIGLLFWNRGKWNGEQVISEEWVLESTKMHVPLSSNHGYGYQWWRAIYKSSGKEIDSFSARGNGGQCIFVFPTLDMVVVLTQGYYDIDNEAWNILHRYIFPAVKN